MLRKLRPRSAYDVMAAIASFIAVAGGTAYAANTIGSADIIDESIQSVDVKNGEVKNPDLGTNSVTSSRIATGNVFNSDLAPDSVNGSKVSANSLTASDLGPDSVSTSELDSTDHSGAIAVGAITNGRCVTVTGSVSGARPGDAVVVTTNGAIPSGVLIYGQRAITDAVHIKVCNLSGATSAAISDLPVRVLTIH